MNDPQSQTGPRNGVGSGASGSAPRCYRCNNEPHQCVCSELAETWEDSGCCGMCDGSVDREEVAETIERLKDEEYERLQRYENNEP